MKRSVTIIAAWIGFCGLILAAIISGIFYLIGSSKQTPITSKRTKSHIENNYTDKETIMLTNPQNSEKYSSLSEEQIRRKIDKSLKTENSDEAITLTKYLSEEAKEEELQHIFHFCIKNGKLNKAEKVLGLFKSSSKREKAKEQIDMERLKK
jgi:hypothetical protein